MPLGVSITIDRNVDLESQLADAAEAVKRGRLIVFPTDTVYGVGCDARNPRAALALVEAKKRPSGKPFPVLVSSSEDISLLASDVPELAMELIRVFLPGPLTIVLPARSDLPEAITGGGDTVGVRIPDDPVVLCLMRMSGCPLVGPSANIAGDPPPTEMAEVSNSIARSADYLIDDGPRTRIPSTVLDLTSVPPRIIREGAISRWAIDRVLADSCA